MKRQWEVEWCESVPTDEHGDADLDNAVNRCRMFPSAEMARAFAEEAAGESYWGVAQIRTVEEIAVSTFRRRVEDPDDDFNWWVDKKAGKIYEYVGECEEVEA